MMQYQICLEKSRNRTTLTCFETQKSSSRASKPVACRGEGGDRFLLNSDGQVFPKGPSFVITSRHPFLASNLKTFIKAPLAPIYLILRGEHTSKNSNLATFFGLF